VSLLGGIATQQYRALWRSQCVHNIFPLSCNEAAATSRTTALARHGACLAAGDVRTGSHCKRR